MKKKKGRKAKKAPVSKLRKGIRGLIKLVGNGRNRRLEVQT